MPKKKGKAGERPRLNTKLRAGDPVMVISGGNSEKERRSVIGKTGKILRLIPKTNRAVVEGLNMIQRHKRASSAQDSSGILEREGSMHISNLMFYAEDLKRPVRLCFKTLDDGKKVRGFRHPETKEFEQIEV